MTRELYPGQEDGDLYHGLTRKLTFDRMVPPYGLEVTYDKTTHIIFPSAVRYVDLGSPNLVAGKADGAENVIRVKAVVRNFRDETNMSVITESGSFYTFNVKYADEPLLLNIEMKDFIHDGSKVNRPNNALDIYLKELGSESPKLVQAAAVQQPAQMTYEEQVALLEKSYELAAKYTPGKDGAGTEKREETEPAANGRKARAVPVGQVSTPVVSSLPQPVSDSVLLARMAQTGYAGFHTAVGKTADGHTRNTIRACVHGDQTIRSGQSVRLRLLEPMRVGRYVLPRNSLVTGEGRIQGERLGIGIIQVEHDGIIIPVELAVYDNDGQEGIFIPGSMEANAAKEVAANLGQNLGTSISITNQSAGDQLLSELGRGAIQGVSQYISRKMREEKVHLKSGYTLMLYQNDNQ